MGPIKENHLKTIWSRFQNDQIWERRLRESFWYRASGRRQTLEEIYFIHRTENKLMTTSLTFKNITICKPWFLKIYLTKQNEKMKEKVRNPRKINGRSVYYLNQDVILRCLMSFLLSISLKSKYGLKLEQRQYKNDSIQSKKIPILNLPRFFPHRVDDEKQRQLQSRILFSTEWSCSYIVLALRPFNAIHKRRDS